MLYYEAGSPSVRNSFQIVGALAFHPSSQLDDEELQERHRTALVVHPSAKHVEIPHPQRSHLCVPQTPTCWWVRYASIVGASEPPSISVVIQERTDDDA
ncbi:hypothetical protein [Mycobacterium sp. 155]|uniref:hypothetical protein n=1 Tax=Mycobacterium sp. 155 TaxID=1157943 RepID=UPI0004756CA6|nr:hypothetical protein [Mycobacterium sp. 155]